MEDNDFKKNWEHILKAVKSHIPAQSFKTWFKPILPIKYENNILTVQVPSQFFYEFLEAHYSELINSSISNILGEGAKIQYSVVMNNKFNYINAPLTKSKSVMPLRGEINDLQLNPKYTFDNFVEGSGNQFAKVSSIAISESPGTTSFNPFLVYGGVGLGKTHLIQAIGNYACSQKKAKKIIYVSSEKFTIDFINSIQTNKTTEFSKLYRNADLLLVDDIQFFAEKEKTQEEFFHTFNSLYQKGKQIVFSCDKPPSELKGLEERLISRFQSGLVVDIQAPDLETRIAILQRKAEENGIELSQEVSLFIATNIQSNIRELEGALIRLMAYASFTGKEITLELSKSILKDIRKYENKNLTVEFIQREVADYFNISEDLLRAKTRKQEAVLARQTAMYLSKELTNNTLTTIGLHFGGRDHATVIHAIKSVCDTMVLDRKYKETVDTIKRKIEVA
ncbi:chromosomal replication initiator protein DnaA [candidate division KSB1 bacterium]